LIKSDSEVLNFQRILKNVSRFPQKYEADDDQKVFLEQQIIILV